MKAGVTGLVLALGALVGALGAAGDRQARGQAAATQPAVDEDRRGVAQRAAALRARLEHRLDEAEHRLEHLGSRRDELQRAIERLDAGEDPSDVLSALYDSGPDTSRPDRRAHSDAAGGSGGASDRVEADAAEPPEALDEFRPLFPELAASISEAWRTEPDLFPKLIERLRPRMRELLELRERDPELAEVKAEEFLASFEMVRATRRLHSAYESGEGVDAARSRVREAIAAAFDATVRTQRFEVRRLNERLVRLRREVNERVERRDRFIERHMERILERARSDGGE